MLASTKIAVQLELHTGSAGRKGVFPMKSNLCVLAMACLLMGSNSALDDDPGTDLKNLQGTWKIVRAEQEGNDVKGQLGYDEFLIEGNSSQVRIKGEVRKGRFQIDPSKTPKQITVAPPGGGEVLGIYELNGDTWKILVPKVGDGRPTSFKDAGLLLEYERVKRKKAENK
jgi:uncharacterized protein (TIGR03067 family)